MRGPEEWGSGNVRQPSARRTSSANIGRDASNATEPSVAEGRPERTPAGFDLLTGPNPLLPSRLEKSCHSTSEFTGLRGF